MFFPSLFKNKMDSQTNRRNPLAFLNLIQIINMWQGLKERRDRKDIEWRTQRHDRRKKRNDDWDEFARRRRLIRAVFRRLVLTGGWTRVWKHPELMNNDQQASNWETFVPHYDDVRFLKKFRLTRDTFNYIVDAVRPFIERNDTRLRKCIPVEKRVAIALYFLKGNCDFWSIADWFRVGKSTVPYILYDFCDAINTYLFETHVKYPTTLEEKLEKSREFFDRWQFPDCFGALDGTHIAILEPPLNAADYFCYKRYHSVIMLALVDANYKFIYAHIGTPGRCNDASIYRRSALKTELENHGENLHIIGDGAFPLTPWLLKPYTIIHNMPEIQRYFNKRLSRARVVVEDAFGRLKGRWRVLLKKSDLNVENIKSVIKTCVVLHNICETRHEPYLPIWDDEVNEYNQQYPRVEGELTQRQVLTLAQRKRDILAQALYDDNFNLQEED